MKRIVFLAILGILTTFTGCTIPDAIFSVFGDHYTGGGYTRAEKEYHYDQQVEASRNYGSSLP